jgi:hypothetical protein
MTFWFVALHDFLERLLIDISDNYPLAKVDIAEWVKMHPLRISQFLMGAIGESLMVLTGKTI